MGVTNDVNSGGGNKASQREFTEEELLLGKNATRIFSLCCVIAFVACVGIAVFAFTNVPWDTRMPYDGKYNRNGSGIPMQIAMIPCLLVLIGLWRAGRKPDAHHMGKGGRVGVYIFGSAMILACVVGQWVMASGILVAGGYFNG
ncbi:hypothetical protein RCH17_003832 [Arthrobacter sp. MP_M7]|nr:hypothetical protein [Arthrobacter sp. MP_M4]MEC5205000.1 hypothetical protein [Arthrobacter sp. MP_M7]